MIFILRDIVRVPPTFHQFLDKHPVCAIMKIRDDLTRPNETRRSVGGADAHTLVAFIPYSQPGAWVPHKTVGVVDTPTVSFCSHILLLTLPNLGIIDIIGLFHLEQNPTAVPASAFIHDEHHLAARAAWQFIG